MAFRPALDLLHHPCVAVGIGEFDHRAPITIVEDVDITGGNAFFESWARPTSGPSDGYEQRVETLVALGHATLHAR
jgi:hypothetical protein